MKRKVVARNRGRPVRRQRHPGVAVAVYATDNRKTGRVNVTYVSQGSCPVTCPYLGCGCYAEGGPVGRVTTRLNSHGAGLTPVEYARAEADAIDGLRADHDLRPHIVGDSRTPAAARVLGEAIDRYVERSALLLVDPAQAWLYTHAWRLVPREAWGSHASVLASCETPADVDAAHARGYAACMTVTRFDSQRLHQKDGLTLLPCPYQTRGVQCVDCRLCMDDRRLYGDRIVIAFEAHGARAGTVRKSLDVLNGVE